MKFSIITCTYNSGAFLDENIGSVEGQTYGDFEHVFVDGYSTDGTVEIIEKYRQRNPDKVRLVQAAPKGISNAMNEGIRACGGDYLIHLHADDNLYDKNVLGDAAKFLDKSGFDWAYGRAMVIEEDGSEVGIHPKRRIFENDHKGWFGKYLMKFYNFVPHQAVFIRKAVFEKFGYFDESLTSAMDPDMWLRIREGTKWSFFDRTVCNYRVRKGAQSSDISKARENRDNYRKVQRRYMNFLELAAAEVVNFILSIGNRSRR